MRPPVRGGHPPAPCRRSSRAGCAPSRDNRASASACRSCPCASTGASSVYASARNRLPRAFSCGVLNASFATLPALHALPFLGILFAQALQRLLPLVRIPRPPEKDGAEKD